MRAVALLATYNERRFIGPCLEHLSSQGIETYLIDNGSTDETVSIAERYLDRGVIGIEELPREHVFDLSRQLRRKEELAGTLQADWFIHLDADELRLPPPRAGTLAEALAGIDRDGYNAVNFFEFTFVPTREQPDHDHPDFEQTLRTYYPFCPDFPHRVNAWKKAAAAAPELVPSGGHRVSFAGQCLYPDSLPMKHYLFLSLPHAVEKYVQRTYPAEEVASGWHGWRAHLGEGDLVLPGETELRRSHCDEDLDPSQPRRRHYIDDVLRAT